MAPHYPQGNVFYRNLHYSYPLIDYGQGVYLYDVEGKKYLDASGGAAVVNIGHGVKEVVEEIARQAQKVGYLNGLQFSHYPVEALAEEISRFLPYPEGRVYFLSSGSEAIEASIKLARQYWVERGQTSKFHVISRRPSYHGNTLAALSLSAREHYKKIFQPMLKENSKIPAPYCYRCLWHEEYPSCGIKCALELEKEILKLGEENVSAFLIEVIGGASTGAAVPPPEYFQIVHAICEKYEILLIVDEVMTGMGRTGKWLACDHYEFSPDIIVMGKGLTGGYFPLSAVAVRSEIVDSISKGGRSFLHAQTYAHHPIGCAAGLATLHYIKKNNLVKKCSEMGDILKKKLLSLLAHSHVGDIRGKGLLLGVEFVSEKKRKKPFLREKKYVEHFLSKAMERGLILWPNIGHADGINGDLVLIAPPFIINQGEISQIFTILEEILFEIENIA